MTKKPIVLIIRDGWGINPGGRDKATENGDATLLAKTPFHDHLYATYPQAKLSASGMDVGLPEGQMGNSEVGHLNLGVGRIVYQDLTRINKAIADGELKTNSVLQEAFAKAGGHRLHFLGLLSDGGVHSHLNHLIALTKVAKESGVEETCSTQSPTAAIRRPLALRTTLRWSRHRSTRPAPGSHGIGRYYAMDRDERWDRNKLAWDAIVLGRGAHRISPRPQPWRKPIPMSVAEMSFCNPSFSPMQMSSEFATATSSSGSTFALTAHASYRSPFWTRISMGLTGR